MPPAMQWFDEGRSRGATHITIDPRCSSTARGSKLHLQPVPGTDLALANGLLHLAIRHGHLDPAYIAERTCGFEQVRRMVRSYWPDRVERITGVPAAQLDEAARLLGEAPTAMVLTAGGPSNTAMAPTPRWPSSTWRWPWAYPADLAAGSPPSPGKATRAGRCRARGQQDGAGLAVENDVG